MTAWTVAHQAPLSMDSSGKNTAVGSHSLLYGIFPTQRSTQVSHIAGSFFTIWATREAPVNIYTCVCVCVCVLIVQSCLTLCVCMDCNLPGYSVHGFSRQKYWNGLPCPSPGNLPGPGIEPGSPTSQADSLSPELLSKPYIVFVWIPRSKQGFYGIASLTFG